MPQRPLLDLDRFIIRLVGLLFSAGMTLTGLAQAPKAALEPVRKLTWAKIPAGRFMMGSQVPIDQVLKDFAQYGLKKGDIQDEYPRHSVEITKPFLMSTTEVTVGQFKAFVQETRYKTRAEVDGSGGWGFDSQSNKCKGRDPRFTWIDPGYPQTENHPVVNVTWEDCQAYCRWLASKEKRIVRLPTEAEWEYSNRANSAEYYTMGNAPESVLSQARTLAPKPETIRQAIQNLVIDPQDPPFPVPVASYPPNDYGLFDMHGNVWEWTGDWYDENYYGDSTTKDPKGPRQGTVKVRRGGAWNSFPLWARSSFRNWNDIDTRCANLGFRVVAELTELEIREYEKTQPIRILFVGDIMLDNGPGHAVGNGIDPFEHCSKLLLDADVTVGNLECVLGTGGRQVNKPYVFRGARDSSRHLKKYFTALSVANNHTLDFGPEGLLDCLDVLKKADIGYFGGGANIEASRAGLILDVKGRKIVLLGYNEFYMEDYEATDKRPGNTPLHSEWVIEDIQYAKTACKADIVIPFIHWGNEMNPMPREHQRADARRWIDAGATAIIGGHPHVTQTIDNYRGSPIVYSLGNFVFDYYSVDPPVWYGWAIRLSIPPQIDGKQGPIDWETITLELDSAGLPHPVDPD